MFVHDDPTTNLQKYLPGLCLVMIIHTTKIDVQTQSHMGNTYIRSENTASSLLFTKKNIGKMQGKLVL